MLFSLLLHDLIKNTLYSSIPILDVKIFHFLVCPRSILIRYLSLLLLLLLLQLLNSYITNARWAEMHHFLACFPLCTTRPRSRDGSHGHLQHHHAMGVEEEKHQTKRQQREMNASLLFIWLKGWRHQQGKSLATTVLCTVGGILLKVSSKF